MDAEAGVVESLRGAAAMFVLIEGAGTALGPLMKPLASASLLASCEREFRTGPRESRARALAATLTRVALDLDDWRLT